MIHVAEIVKINFNSSQLLLQLAKMCRTTGMHIERMTEWTVLSDVQQKFIEDAYLKIEGALVQ